MLKTDSQVNFRMPTKLRDMLKSAAEANNRTLTAEIVARLERSFNDAAEAEMSALQDVMNKRFDFLEEEIERLRAIYRQGKK